MEDLIVTEINGIGIKKSFTEGLPYNPALKNRAKALRKAGVLSEVIFWKQVRNGNFYNIDFDRQRIIGSYIVDFYIKSLSLIIEIDGTSHNGKDVYDSQRDSYLISLGLRVYRISDLRIKHDLENVLKELTNYIIQNYRLV